MIMLELLIKKLNLCCIIDHPTHMYCAGCMERKLAGPQKWESCKCRYEAILRRSLRCSLLLDGLYM